MNGSIKFALAAIFFSLVLVSCTSPEITNDNQEATENPAETTTLINDSPDGSDLFHSRCMVCHLDKRPTVDQRANMLAPPIMGVMFHLKDTLKGNTEEESRRMVIEFIVDYAQNPAREKSYCMPAAIDRFGVMPSISASTTAEEVEAIAKYLYDNYPPKNFNHNQLDSTIQGGNKRHGSGRGNNK